MGAGFSFTAYATACVQDTQEAVVEAVTASSGHVKARASRDTRLLARTQRRAHARGSVRAVGGATRAYH